MFTFLTLSSPHLGYMYSSSSLIDAGFLILNLKVFLILLRNVIAKKMKKKFKFKVIII